MILERVELTAREGEEDAFAASFDTATLGLIACAPGCRKVQAGRGIEAPGKMILLVEWDRLEDHTAFTGSAEHKAFGQRIGAHVAGGAMEHFDLV